MTHPDSSNVRISNYVKIIDKQQVRFDPQWGLKKSFINKKWIIIGKVAYSKINYCKIKKTEDSIEQKK